MLRLLILFALPLMAFDATTLAKNIQKNNHILEYMLKAQNPKAYKAYADTKKRKEYIEKKLKTPYFALIYLTSSSVPPEHFIKTALEVGQLNGIDVITMPMMRGMNDSLKNQVEGYRSAMKNYTPKRKDIISQASDKLRLSPALFKVLKVESVPVMVTAKCVGGVPSPERCEIYYVARGETTLSAMALKAGLTEKKSLFGESK